MLSSIQTLRNKLTTTLLETRAVHRMTDLAMRSPRIEKLGTCPQEENTDLPREGLFKSCAKSWPFVQSPSAVFSRWPSHEGDCSGYNPYLISLVLNPERQLRADTEQEQAVPWLIGESSSETPATHELWAGAPGLSQPHSPTPPPTSTQNWWWGDSPWKQATGPGEDKEASKKTPLIVKKTDHKTTHVAGPHKTDGTHSVRLKSFKLPCIIVAGFWVT